MPGSLSGQVLIMTGGAMGFGECMAKAAAREGASVMIADANLPEAERVMDAIESAGGTAAAVEADVTDGAQVRNMTEETVGGFGHVDVLVNNAGVSGPSREFVDIEKQDWDAVMDINVNGPFLCCRAVLPHMIERRSGHIVNISSATARVGFTHPAQYSLHHHQVCRRRAVLDLVGPDERSWDPRKRHLSRPRGNQFPRPSPKEYFVDVRCLTEDHTVGPLLYTLTELEGTGHSVEAIAWHEERGSASAVSYIHD